MKKFFDDFKAFISRGNVVDMAIGVVVGGAFSKIISSLVENIIMPLIGIITGKIDLSSLKLVITPAGGGAEELSLKYGMFLQSLVDFLIIALAIFCTIKIVTVISKKLERKKSEEVPPPPEESEETILLREIRDLLRKH